MRRPRVRYLKSDISFLGWKSLSFLPHRHLRGTLPTPRRHRRSPRAFLSSDQSMGWSWKGYEDLIFSALRSFPAALSGSDKKVDDNMTENTGARSGESKLSQPAGSSIGENRIELLSEAPSVGFSRSERHFLAVIGTEPSIRTKMSHRRWRS